ncbi:MAG TPA: NUDIX domain-containing protein [Candidatus Saccharimonadales bacterium]|nr:NUDIX domain-containing protein [Candidatus Saccharimonadales bacterium]
MDDNTMLLCRDITGAVHLVKRSELRKRSAVYGVIIHDEGVVLVCDRTSDERWDLPGGGVEAGEDLMTALQREVQEETGLLVAGAPQKICDFIEYFYDIDSNQGWESHRYFYRVQTSGAMRTGGNDDDIVDLKHFADVSGGGNIAPVATAVIKIAQA